MWLLDANMDVHLVAVLADLGIPSDTAASGGWKALSNSDLVAVAAAAGFDCLLTRDQLFGESASRALRSFPRFAVVVVNLPQQRWPQYRDRFMAPRRNPGGDSVGPYRKAQDADPHDPAYSLASGARPRRGDWRT